MYEIVGKMKGKSKKTGNEFGILYVIDKDEQKNVEGFTTESIFVDVNYIDDLSLYDVIEVSYNKYGRVKNIQVVG